MMKQQGFVFLLFCLGAIVLRVFSFFPTVINHDESTYIVIADAMLKGQVYFVDVIDTKPIGIFLIYAGLMSVFGKSIFLLRLWTAIFMGATAFLLYKAHRTFGSKEHSAIASGVIYLLITSIFKFFGVSPNTECFFNLFTMLSLWLILRQKGGLEYVGAGLSLGLGFAIKYVVGFDGLAFALFLFIKQVQKNKKWLLFWWRAAALAIGFFAVLFGVYKYYADLGALDDFIFHTVEVPKTYPKEIPWFIHIKFMGDFFLRFLPISLFYFTVFLNKSINRNLLLLGGLWSIA
ncbi:MAG: glycosyltransferase family 39 protein, partial [Bacteroidota bacterium]